MSWQTASKVLSKITGRSIPEEARNSIPRKHAPNSHSSSITGLQLYPLLDANIDPSCFASMKQMMFKRTSHTNRIVSPSLKNYTEHGN